MENNKLIAEFMGFELQTNPNERWFNQWLTTSNGVWANRIEILHFDSDWNWLMQVVLKIYHLEIEVEEVLVIRDALADANLENTYQAVVEFIRWYNNKQIQDSIDIDSWSK